MRTSLLVAATMMAACTLGASAQNYMERPTFKDNWSIGLDAGLTTPIKGHSFFQNMRQQYGIHVAKQLTPVVGVGVEGLWGINTTSSANAFDTQYVGPYMTVDFCNLFGGFTCTPRPFTLEAQVGMGWMHQFYTERHDINDIGAKMGLNFNFRVSDNFSVAVKPAIVYNLSGTGEHTQFNAKRANFDLMVGFNYNFGPGFKCVECPDYSGDVAALNDQVNALRAELDGTAAALAASTANNAALAAALEECRNQPAKVVADTTLNSVRYVFFKIGSSVITPDQQPNVEMVASYLKNHPESYVVIKGYASQDGPVEVNERLAAARAESVKKALVKKYKVNPDRIKAEGQGIGHMFSEESWNRVSICTLETK